MPTTSTSPTAIAAAVTSTRTTTTIAFLALACIDRSNVGNEALLKLKYTLYSMQATTTRKHGRKGSPAFNKQMITAGQLCQLVCNSEREKSNQRENLAQYQFQASNQKTK
ncbi:hypothetical protein Tsp_03110 [Trichinella spiralis]|uniref:hypothetical protein n=1 Tax=Trichinella spiralis TaxID=6334 RepID=UPI0001EFB9E4|nr:hypothetical protein Tsp_03110 [Trichinella spiralis]